jgi:hypothetical protein
MAMHTAAGQACYVKTINSVQAVMTNRHKNNSVSQSMMKADEPTRTMNKSAITKENNQGS